MRASASCGGAVESVGREARFASAAGAKPEERAAQRRSELDHALESLLAILGMVLVGLVSAALHALPPG